jgi:hypothetical protein
MRYKEPYIPSMPSSRHINLHSEPYTCPELKRNPGIPAERFRAYELPSRIGDQLIYPKGVIPVEKEATKPTKPVKRKKAKKNESCE